jgi:glycosyltransferase involved in cell wall biosynthesis
MPRLLIAVNDAPFFLSHRLPIARGARAAGYEVHIATPDHPRRVDIERHGLIFHPFPLSRSGASPSGEIGTVRALAGLYRSLRPDLVHHVAHKVVLYGSLAARWTGVPAVVNAVSGLGYVFLAPGARARLRRRAVLAGYRVAFGHPRCRGIFQNTDDVEVFLRSHAIREAQVVVIRGSGVDLDAYHPRPEPGGRPLVVLASRMLWDKGVGEFVAAVRMLKDRGVAFRAALVGDSDAGNPAAVPPDQLGAWVKEGVIEWWGRREDVPEVLAQANVVCLPSYREGLPKVLLEAAASGRAIVTTDVPGCREVVRPGVNGLVVPARDAATLATALERLLGEPDLRREYGTRSRAIAEAEFGVDQVVTKTLAVYEGLLR